MRRLPIRGASLVTPQLDESELKSALSKLGVVAVFSNADVHELYVELAALYGRWLAERDAMQASSVASALWTTGGNLLEASRLLSGHQTGLKSQIELEVTLLSIEFLALDPTVGRRDRAEQVISAFREDAVRVGHACQVASKYLAQRAVKDGRDRLLWYDEFTALLLRTAKKAGIKPNLNRDRATGKPGGWLFEAAQALEPFLDSWMRSPSAEACAKRLERSRKHLLNTHRQKTARH